ncbi:MAG: hypothetical protein K2F83_04440, partial [Oscillospiraceae bacterium]|nr:hypothetical protein [Oscillospiraceae bacterium]
YTLLALADAEKKPTSLWIRFKGFAAWHFGVSIMLSAFLSIPLGTIFLSIGMALKEWGIEINGTMLCWLLGLTMMGMYYPMGIMAAGSEWTYPKTWKEKVRAVMQPTMVAWFWVATVLATLLLGSDFLLVEFFISLFLAAPSSVVVLLSIRWWPFGSVVWDFVSLILIGLISGFLPPLLFALGSFWQASRRERKNAKQKRTELHEATN